MDTPFTCVPSLVSISITPGRGHDDGRELRTRREGYARRALASVNTGPLGMNRQLCSSLSCEIPSAYGRLPVGEIKTKKTRRNGAATRGFGFAGIRRDQWGYAERQESEACGTCISQHNKGLENGERVSSREGGGGGALALSSALTHSMKNRFRESRACSDAKLPFWSSDLRASLSPNNLAR